MLFRSVTISITDGNEIITITVVVDSNGDWSSTFDLSSLDDTQLTVTALETDAGGNTDTDVATFEKQSNLPILTIDDPLESDNIVNADEVSTVTVSGEGEDGLTVSFVVTDSMSNTVPGSALVSGTTWSSDVNLSTLVDGTLTITATEPDGIGNEATASQIGRAHV